MEGKRTLFFGAAALAGVLSCGAIVEAARNVKRIEYYNGSKGPALAISIENGSCRQIIPGSNGQYQPVKTYIIPLTSMEKPVTSDMSIKTRDC